MNFAENILKKFGWKKGESLGKNRDGIKAPIKAHRKTSKSGFGSNFSSEISGNNWWERVYDEASNNLKVEKAENGQICVSQKDDDGVEITNKSYSVRKLKKKSKDVKYDGTFIKSATFFSDVGQEKDIDNHVRTEDIQVASKTSLITDEELFSACRGMTAHKGARHGLKLSGKLNRITEQDNILMSKLKNRLEPIQEGIFREINVEDTDLKTPEWQNSKEKPKKFIISSVDDHPNLPKDDLIDVLNVANYSKKSKKKRKKDRKTEQQLIEKIESALEIHTSHEASHDDESRTKKSKIHKLNTESKIIKKKKKHRVTLEKIEEAKADTKKEVGCKKLKQDSDSESSATEGEDVVERINEEMHHVRKKRKIDKCEDPLTDFEKQHKRSNKKFKANKLNASEWKKPSKKQKKMEKKLCKKLSESI